MMNLKEKVIERLLRYAKVNTQSDETSDTTPSTEGQWDLAHMLVEELKEIGMEDVTIDERAYVMATLPENVDGDVPTIGWLAHLDTATEFTGENVNPQVWESYDGSDLLLNKEGENEQDNHKDRPTKEQEQQDEKASFAEFFDEWLMNEKV